MPNISQLPSPICTENTVEQIVGGPMNGWFKWTIGFEGQYTDPDAMSITPTPAFPIYMTLVGLPDDRDAVDFGGGPVTYPLSVEGTIWPWVPGGLTVNGNLFGGMLGWTSDTIVEGADTDHAGAPVSGGSGHPPFTGTPGDAVIITPFYGWDISSVKPGAITHIGDVLYFPPTIFGSTPMPNGWFMSARQFSMDGKYQTWSNTTDVHQHLRPGTGDTETTHTAFIGGMVSRDIIVGDYGPRDTTKLFNTLAVYEGDDLGSLSEVGSSGNSSKDGGVTFTAVAGREYHIQVGAGVPGLNGSAVLTWG